MVHRELWLKISNESRKSERMATLFKWVPRTKLVSCWQKVKLPKNKGEFSILKQNWTLKIGTVFKDNQKNYFEWVVSILSLLSQCLMRVDSLRRRKSGNNAEFLQRHMQWNGVWYERMNFNIGPFYLNCT